MLRKEFASQANGNGERFAARIMTRFLLAYCEGLTRLADGDLLRGLILAAILEANTGHLTDQRQHGELGGLDATVPDELRHPVSISALSRTLSVPYETTRRHVAKLVAEGICARTDKGVYVREDWISQKRDVTSALYASLKLMLISLFEAGFDLEGMARAGFSGEDRKALKAALG